DADDRRRAAAALLLGGGGAGAGSGAQAERPGAPPGRCRRGPRLARRLVRVFPWWLFLWRGALDLHRRRGRLSRSSQSPLSDVLRGLWELLAPQPTGAGYLS